ncbi:MAG: hypothetical protein ABIH90_01620 [Candidatus Aenigmatarchaeota archaeon]
MKVNVGVGIPGCFAFDDKGKLVDFVLFTKDAAVIAEKLKDASRGEKVPEEKKLNDKLEKRGYSNVQTGSHEAEKLISKNLRKLVVETGFLKEKEIQGFLFEIGAAGLKKILKKERKEKIIFHIIGLMDDLDKHLNMNAERLREWYGLYFPEATHKIKSNEALARTAAKGKRENTEEYSGLAKISVGMHFGDDDVKNVSSFAKKLLDMFDERTSLEKYLGKLVTEEAPNTNAVAGTVLTARLLASGGGLEKLSRMPSSRIQLLGAEKALFRHMRENTKAPKYGLLFGHDLVQKAPEHKKGKVARSVASKISLAMKMDFFSNKDQGKELREELEKEVEKIMGEK